MHWKLLYKIFSNKLPSTQTYSSTIGFNPIPIQLNATSPFESSLPVEEINGIVNSKAWWVSSLNETAGLNLSIEKIVYVLNDIAQKSISNNKMNKKRLPRKPWITSTKIKSCETKKNFYKIWKEEPQNQISKTIYQEYANKLNYIIIFAKQQNNSEYIKE